MTTILIYLIGVLEDFFRLDLAKEFISILPFQLTNYAQNRISTYVPYPFILQAISWQSDSSQEKQRFMMSKEIV